MATEPNYVLGRGEIWFSRFLTGTKDPAGFFYLGNSPEFNITVESEDLDHFSSDFGIREKDDSVALEVTRSGSIIVDDISPKNLGLFLFGDDSVVTVVAAAGLTEVFQVVEQGVGFKIGISASNPAGVFGIDPATFVVDDGGVPVVYTIDVDYSINTDTGFLTIIEGGGIPLAAPITVSYDLLGTTRDRVISGSTPVEGAVWYYSRNAKGKNMHYMLPHVKFSPNGDYALKGDEWQQIPFSIEVLKRVDRAAIYGNGTPI